MSSQPPTANNPPPSTASSTSSITITKTPISINIYDLLPPGRLSSTLWFFGASLLHTGVVVRDREYAFGGHYRRNVTGVYWTKPQEEPPGGTFRQTLLHGFTYASDTEIEAIVHEASQEFLGLSYNLLTRNCNHFTNHLCHKLTGIEAPKWINRAASIGVAVPCVLPLEWIEPPECELEDEDEEARLTGRGRVDLGRGMRERAQGEPEWRVSSDEEETDGEGGGGELQHPGKKKDLTKMGLPEGEVKHSEGRELPAAERTRLDHTVGNVN